MRKIQVTALTLLVLFLTTVMGWAGRREKEKKAATKEQTLYGSISCTVAKDATPKPGGNGSAPTPGANGVPQAPVPNGGPQTAAKPINTVQDCLANGGKVMIAAEPDQVPLAIENPEALRGHEWHRLSISGYMSGDAFHIMSVRVL